MMPGEFKGLLNPESASKSDNAVEHAKMQLTPGANSFISN
jgi:hypothetical protein